MAVVRLDSFTLANAATAAGEQPATEQYTNPVNGLVTFIVSGTAAGLAAVIEVFDGTNWVQVQSAQVNITANGTYNWTGAAQGVRAKITAITSGAVTIVAVFQDFVG